jgi:hypothetical protein
VVDKLRVDGSRVRLAEVEVGDETGTVSLRARDEQIDILSDISKRSGAVVLRNCTLELYQGKHMRMAITKWGKLSAYPDHVASTPPPPSKMNQDRNFSLIDLSLVASEMVASPQSEQYSKPFAEGPANPMANRQTSFQPGPAMARRGRRPSPRGNPGGPDPAMQAHYGQGGMSNLMRYQGGMQHGYSGGYADVMEAQSYNYPPRQLETMPSAQHMMMHQQFEMQQRQMQQQQYHNPHDRQRSLQPGSPMLGPGIENAGCFDTSYTGGSDVPMPMLALNPFLVPIAQSPPQGPYTPSRSESPMSPGKMNPQAATFDPNSNKPDDK